MLNITLQLTSQYYNMSLTWELEFYNSKPIFSIATNSSVGLLDSIINESRWMVIIVRGGLSQEEFSYAINKSH